MKHIATVHEGINPFKCSVCDVEFANKQFEEAYKMRESIHLNVQLYIYMNSVHEGIKPFHCKICEYNAGLR